MARARNAGMRRLLERMPDLELIQFLDGDCELQPTWLEHGQRTMQARPDAAVVSGRRRERHRDANIYHRLMDMEWDTPIGEVDACHGDAMMRVAFLRAAGPFDERLIAGEEPELCVRLRAAGGRILRVDAEMSLHDVAIDRFGQWWRRCLRSGHAEAQGSGRHGWLHDKAASRVLLSAWLWVFFVPLGILVCARLLGGWALAGVPRLSAAHGEDRPAAAGGAAPPSRTRCSTRSSSRSDASRPGSDIGATGSPACGDARPR